MKQLKKRILIVLFLGLGLVASSFGQQALKIAVIDSGRALETSIEGKKAITQVQEREYKIKFDLQKLDEGLRSLETRLNTGRLTMNQDSLLTLQQEYDRKTTDKKRYEEDATKDFNQFKFSLGQRIQQDMNSIVSSLAKERGYDVVFERETGVIVYFSLALDITDEVVRRFDASRTSPAPVKK